MKRRTVLPFASVIALAIIGGAIIVWVMELPREVHYNITVSKSVYKFPYWNMTLDFNVEDAVELVAVQLEYGEQMLKEQKIGMDFYKGDSLTLAWYLDAHLSPFKPCKLYVYFPNNRYMTLNLEVPL